MPHCIGHDVVACIGVAEQVDLVDAERAAHRVDVVGHCVRREQLCPVAQAVSAGASRHVVLSWADRLLQVDTLDGLALSDSALVDQDDVEGLWQVPQQGVEVAALGPRDGCPGPTGLEHDDPFRRTLRAVQRELDVEADRPLVVAIGPVQRDRHSAAREPGVLAGTRLQRDAGVGTRRTRETRGCFPHGRRSRGCRGLADAVGRAHLGGRAGEVPRVRSGQAHLSGSGQSNHRRSEHSDHTDGPHAGQFRASAVQRVPMVCTKRAVGLTTTNGCQQPSRASSVPGLPVELSTHVPPLRRRTHGVAHDCAKRCAASTRSPTTPDYCRVATQSSSAGHLADQAPDTIS